MAMFPSIQCDMKVPTDFYKVVIGSMISLVSMMLPVAVSAYAVYVNEMKPNILEQINPGKADNNLFPADHNVQDYSLQKNHFSPSSPIF